MYTTVIGKLINNVKDFYKEINTATLTGAIDVVVVEQPDGSFKCSPFHVRFGKLGVLRSREKVVDMEINGEPLDIHMKLGESGEAFFVEEISAEDLASGQVVPPHMACSPIPDESYLPAYRPGYTDLSSVEGDWRNTRPEVCQNLNYEGLELSNNQDSVDILYKHSEDDVNTTKETDFSSKPLITTSNNFSAEVVNQTVSKPNIDFRPISDIAVELCDEKNLVDEKKNALKNGSSKEEAGKSYVITGAKRKRRKKGLLKKKLEQEKNLSNSNRHLEQMKGSESKNVFPQAQYTKDEAEQIFNLDVNTLNTSLKEIVHSDNFISSDCVIQEICTVFDNNEEFSRMQQSSTDADFHFFSDTEVTPGCNPSNSRPSSPFQSDTEIEVQRTSVSEQQEISNKLAEQSWRWGELPTPLPRPVLGAHSLRNSTNMKSQEIHDQEKDDEEQRSLLSGMFSFMKKTKRIRHNPESEGIYLDDLNASDMDPEVAALYFPTSYRAQVNQLASSELKPGDEGENDEVKDDDGDNESGNGSSLPQSPHSVEGAVCGSKSLNDFEDFKKIWPVDLAMSLCGGLDQHSFPSDENFQKHQLTYDDLERNPGLLEMPELVVRLNGKYLKWQLAAPQVVTMLLFQKPLSQEVVENFMIKNLPPESPSGKDAVSETVSRRGYSSWFSWRRVAEPTKTEQSDMKNKDNPDEIINSFGEEKSELLVQRPTSLPQPVGGEYSRDEMIIQSVTHSMLEMSPLKNESKDGYSGSESSDESDSVRILALKMPRERSSYYVHTGQYRKTLRLSSKQIEVLNLKEGPNEVTFSVTTAYQGTTRCKCHIYKWRYDDKIVISDIDGTITKSDVLGHLFAIVGKDWVQNGVAQLFTKIKNNGYKLLYLSARAIGQAHITREYLRSIRQNDLTLPDGPLLLSPTSLVNAFHREVIEKKPQDFKIPCLKDIKALFPTEIGLNPFYAGYGNRVTDVFTYREVGIPIFRIFTINTQGELKHEFTKTFQSSYSNMTTIVDQIFPPPVEQLCEDYSDFAYWRDPIPDIEIS
uniref:phosphatidate phosphatase n=1 Tax=Timema genevievae TaxID=629358 RepID=A0A7R9JYF9_TIMGE|nr:unnamed protein product [Timema genevievae]